MSYFKEFTKIIKDLDLEDQFKHIIEQNYNFRNLNFYNRKSKKELEIRKKQKRKKKAIKKLRRKLRNKNR